MDKTYAELKEKGLVTILNTGDGFALSYAQFNVDTGEQVEDKVFALDIKSLQNENEILQAKIDANKTLISDAQATPITPPTPLIESLPADQA